MRVELTKDQQNILLGFLFMIRNGIEKKDDRKAFTKVKKLINALSGDQASFKLKTQDAIELHEIINVELSTPNEIPDAKENEPKTRYEQKDWEALKQLQQILLG